MFENVLSLLNVCIISGSSDISHESISAQEYSADDSRSSFDTQASLGFPPQTPSSSTILPPNSEAEFEYLCQQAASDADTMPSDQADNYTGVDDETIVRNLRRTSGNLLSDALNMALEEASQFVMEQSNEVYSNVGQDYNLVELAPWDSSEANPNTNQGAYSETSAGYGAETNNPDTSFDAIVSMEYTQSENKSQHVHTHGNTQGMTSNVQYEISSATNLLYGSDQPCFEQDTYGNQQFTNLQNRHQNMLGLLNSSTVNSLGPQNVQPINHWQNTSNNLRTHQGNATRLGVNNLPLVSSVSQLAPQALYGSGMSPSGGTSGTQLEKSFLEQMASIDLMPPMQGCTVQATATSAGEVQGCSVSNSSTSNAVPNVTPLPSTSAFVSQSIVPSSNSFTQDPNSVGGGVAPHSTLAPISAVLPHTGGQLSDIPASNPYSGPGTQTFVNTTLPVSGGGQIANNAFLPGGIAPNSMLAANTMISKPNFGTGKGLRQCPGCQQFFNHARNKYCDKCHERCATTPKSCVKCSQLFTSSNICRKLCDNCQKRPANKPEESKRVCSNCSQEFVTANSCRKYCDNCKTRSKEATTTKCATCNADFVRSKQLRKYCATCQIKDRGEILQRKCLQCDNVYSDSNMNRKLCYTCRKHGSVTNTNLVSQSWTRPAENSTAGTGALKSQYSSVKEYLAKSIIQKEMCATAAKAEKAPTGINVPSISCGKCGNYFATVDPSKNFCNSCEQNSAPVAEISPKQCILCAQLFNPSDGTKTRCETCDTLTLAKCTECQKEFLPGVQCLGKCDICAAKRKEMKIYAKCEKCSSPQNEGKRFCLNCQETKKKQNEPRKCEGCDNMISHTPRKFCDSCREANEKPQVREEQFNMRKGLTGTFKYT